MNCAAWSTICGPISTSIFLEHQLVDVAPHPVFAGFERADDGVFGGVKVLGGVFIF
jgi:hypothetical protein